MVKKIILMMIFILALTFVSAENVTNETLESYNFDYIADGIEITLLEKVDTRDSTTLTYSLVAEPGNYEVSSALGTKVFDETFYSEESEFDFSVTFEKVFAGEKEFVLMIYKDDSLIVFISNQTMNVENSVKLSATVDSLIVNEGSMHIVLDFDTSLPIEESVFKIINSKGTIYENEVLEVLDETRASYTFTPKESGEYFFYSLNLDGFVKEYNGSLGTYNFDIIKNFKESQDKEGITITFDSTCDCSKEISVFSTENEFVYKEITNENSIFIPAEAIISANVNGPYKVIVNAQDKEFEYLTSEYNYGDFEVLVAEEEVAEEEVVEETTSSGSSGTPVNGEIMIENETIIVLEEEVVLENESVADESEMSEVEKESFVDIAKEKASNLITGFSVKMPSFENNKKVLGIAAIIIALFVIISFVYIKQKRDSYLYEM